MQFFTNVTRPAVVASILLVGTLTACQGEVKEHASEVNLQSVVTQQLVLAESYLSTQEFTGTIRAGNTTGIGFELAGKIKQLAVDSGDTVQKGQLLAQLDTRLLEAQQLELEASLSQNRADLDLAKSTLKRSVELQKQGYTSDQKLDELKGQLNSLLAARKRLNASIQANALKIDKSSLIAPFNGVISRRAHNLGEVVGLGTPIYTLIESQNPQATVGVPIEVATSLKPKQSLQLRVAQHMYTAQLEGIGAEVNPITRTVPLRLSLPIDSQVINGELAYLEYEKLVNESGFWVPISAVTDGVRGLWNLYVLAPSVNQSDKSFEIERRDVEIIYTKNEMAYIRGAVSADDEFVSQGLHKLVVGQRVTRNTSIAATR